MSYELFITPSARKQLKKLPTKMQQAIREKLDGLCVAPFAGSLDTKKLKGREGYRLRVGVYRVIYELDGNRLVLSVVEVGHRQNIYD